MVIVSPSLSIITLNINYVNPQIKRQSSCSDKTTTTKTHKNIKQRNKNNTQLYADYIPGVATRCTG